MKYVSQIGVLVMALGTLTRTVPQSSLIGVAAAQSGNSDFHTPLSTAITSAEADDLVSLRQNLKEAIGDDLNSYSCYVLLPGSESCEVYLYEGRQKPKNFLVWDYGRGKTREAADKVFEELVKGIVQAMPSDWVGQETPRSDLRPRELRVFKASAKSDSSETLGGPIITIEATRLGEFYRVTVQLNTHHVT
jgi:hypothetical protein